MKAPSKTATLGEAQPQAERYWRASEDPDGRYDAVRYVVLCSFHRILVWDMRRPSRPSANLTLDELPDHYEALGFLLGEGQEASFVEHHRTLTLGAAEAISTLYHSLKDRDAAPADVLIRFVMQCVWTLFAEDLQMLRGYPLQTIVARLMRDEHPNSARDIGFLFRVLNQKGSHNRTGELSGTTYVNGELFADPAEVDLNAAELALLARAATFDWRRVDPTIFGSLMEGVLGRDRRWEVGAHYTHEVDILKIVEPTIVRPWQERIAASASAQQARDLLDELCAFRVLDPACGCGNFLYVAYRELRSLEAQLKERIRSLAAATGSPVPPGHWPFVPLTNMQGIDIEGTAVLIARVVLWMGHRQMIELFGEAEPPLPLIALDAVRREDALRSDWPETDCIVGNPPFLGSQHLRGAVGDDYIAWLKREFGVGVKDFCVYWFRKARSTSSPASAPGSSAPTASARTVLAPRPCSTSWTPVASSRTPCRRRSGRGTPRCTSAWSTGSKRPSNRSGPSHSTASPSPASVPTCGPARAASGCRSGSRPTPVAASRDPSRWVPDSSSARTRRARCSPGPTPTTARWCGPT